MRRWLSVIGLMGLFWAGNAWAAPVTLEWDAATSGGTPTGYTMYRKVGTGAFVAIGTTAVQVRTFTDSAPAVGTNVYRVTAVNTEGESSPSNEVTFQVSMPPGVPVNLRVRP